MVITSKSIIFPEEAGIKVYSSVEGFTLNRKNRMLEFITKNRIVKDPTTGNLVKLQIINDEDIQQMFEYGITGGLLSFDAPDFLPDDFS